MMRGLYYPNDNEHLNVYYISRLIALQVLQALQYIDKTNTVQLKGRVACEISNSPTSTRI